MKKMILMATVAAFIAVPAMANEKSPEDMQRMTQHYFSKIDTDGNGQISKAEHDAFGEKMFSDADANDDNALSMEEVVAQKTKEKNEWKAAKPARKNTTTPAE